MAKTLRIILLFSLVISPIIFYKTLNKKNDSPFEATVNAKQDNSRPEIALIFDDLGESLNELRDIHSLDVPLTISIIPGLKFSRNIAHIGSRCGFSVLIHLPMQPEAKNSYKTDRYKFISEDLKKREIASLLRYYLNSIRVAIGINNHMGSKVTQSREIMSLVLDEVKIRDFIFVDSRTSLKSVAYDIAKEKGIQCAYNSGFLDSFDDIEKMGQQMDELIIQAKEAGRIVVIAHPRKTTIKFLKDKLPLLRKKVKFITLKDYFKP